MEELKTIVGKSQIKILTGLDFDINAMFVAKNEGHRYSKNPKCSLEEIVNSKIMPLTKSSDPRFDKKDLILQSIDQIKRYGLSSVIVDKICKNKSSIKYHRIMGQYSFLNQIITKEEKLKINNRLRLAFMQQEKQTFIS